ncbi:hypothetical protein SASPL_108447 [Salvia splendens]|uniref:Solute carrier family 50 (Sugar transporter) n=1 Tax=Salvia splendens TaxID=180675 RepID=A0A8X9A5D7_SALSN|nr:hypothetical protein SASPL_108447 [Salvia splendens]
MEPLIFFVGVIGNIISVLVFLSPVKTFARIVKHKTTEEFESLPYICTLLNSSLWTYYGIIKPDAYLVATVNGFGVVVELIYVALFFYFASLPSIKAKTAILFGVIDVGFLVAAVLATYLALQGDARIDAIGFISSALNIVMYASPLAAMVPNVIGLLLGIIQLALYAIYNTQPSKHSHHTDPLLPISDE